MAGQVKRHMSTEMSLPTNEFLRYKYHSQNETEELVLAVKEVGKPISNIGFNIMNC